MSGAALPRVLVVAGPTATGKTRLGIELARRCGGEIVSADSMQVYRRMDIGTAKADAAERAAAVHHMLDVVEPWEDYSVSRYVQDAAACCDDILRRGRLPILVGGTGLYIDSLLSGRDFAQREAGDEGLRRSLEADYARLGGEAMLARLAAVDPERAAKLQSGDRRRIVRALEIYQLTGRTITAHDAETRARPPRYQAARVLLCYRDRADLYRRIDRRVEEMARAGLFEELERLLAEGLPADCTALQAIGYKEALLALRGTLSREQAVALIQQNSRRYAKRQLTWFRRAEDALWIEWDGTPNFPAAVAAVEARWPELFPPQDRAP